MHQLKILIATLVMWPLLLAILVGDVVNGAAGGFCESLQFVKEMVYTHPWLRGDTDGTGNS